MATFVDHKAADWRDRERGGGGYCHHSHHRHIHGVKLPHSSEPGSHFGNEFYTGALAADGGTDDKCMDGRCRPVFTAHALIVADSLSATLNKVTFSLMYLRACTASTTPTAFPVVTKSDAGIVCPRPRREGRTHLGLFGL